MALAIHGTPAHTHDTSGTAATVSASITTTVADTILVAVIAGYQQGAGTAVRTVTGVSGGGLTWTKRAANAGVNGASSTLFVGLEVWWAHASGTLTAQSITATFSAVPNTRCDILVFAVSGSQHLSAPWDTNVSLPINGTSGTATGSSTPSASGNTTSTNSMLFGFLDYAWNANAANTVGSGYSDIIAATTDNGLRDNWEQKSVTSAGAQTFNFTGFQQFWNVIGDALNGDAATGNTGTISTALTKASQSLAGVEKFTGTVNTALTKASQSLAGAEKIIASSITTNLTKASQSLAGAEKFTGTISTALTKASQSLAGTEKIIANSITTNLTKASQSLAGAEKFTGTVNTALTKPSQSAVGFIANAEITGVLVTTLGGIAIATVAEEDFVASAVTRLGKVAMAAIGEEDFVGHIVTRLGGENGQIVANVVQAEEIILGPITMALPPFRPLILGAQLGMPGAGNWYSWRQTDN